MTGITLSRHQLKYVQRELVEKESLPAKLVYSDFFDFEPEQSFDAIAMLGVIEVLVLPIVSDEFQPAILGSGCSPAVSVSASPTRAS